MIKNGKRLIIRIPDEIYYNLKAMGVNISDFTRKALLQRMNTKSKIDKLKKNKAI